ncbi:MAG: hypothetical protein ACR2NM_08535 [Bythopirellula sp.]
MNRDDITNLGDFRLFKTVYNQTNQGSLALDLAFAGQTVSETSTGSLSPFAYIALPWVRHW